MPFTNQVTELVSYKKYLQRIGVVPNIQLKQCFSAGLPAVWLYMKALGLEKVFFDLLHKVESRELLFKELFYLLQFTNSGNKFFTHVPENFLHIAIPPEIAAAQVEIDKPAFAMAYSFTKDQLTRVLKEVAQPKAMIRLGTKHQSIGLMYDNQAYDIYHADNPGALAYKNLDNCVELIMRVLPVQKNSSAVAPQPRVPLFMSATYLKGMAANFKPMPDSRPFLKEFCRQDFVRPTHSRKADM